MAPIAGAAPVGSGGGLWICGRDGQNQHGAATGTDSHSNSGPARTLSWPGQASHPRMCRRYGVHYCMYAAGVLLVSFLAF